MYAFIDTCAAAVAEIPPCKQKSRNATGGTEGSVICTFEVLI